ncbi:MAG: 50S ribosomal protein L3 N(5)-glutamine methyltransferase [Coxiellaceae bacterium]|nr:50S ribosomal protein L3 N(5)-glutamine methyltransferase [Coxiellaceae bacterium]
MKNHLTIKRRKKKTRALNTIGDFIHFAAQQFSRKKAYFGHGTDNPWDEAVYLVLSFLHLPLNSNKTILCRKLKDDEKQTILAGIKTRVDKRLPVAYLTKEAWFMGLSFYVDENVLIPRSPLGELIAKRFTPWIKPEKVLRILDIGTGSGCIAISLALVFPRAKIDAVDISSQALKIAAINCTRYKVTNRARLLQSDLFAKLRDQKYDIIISNPPYVSLKEIKNLPKEYTYEPRLALFGGGNGCEIITRIIKDASQHLTPQGILVVEVGSSAAKIMRIYKYLPFVWLEFEHGVGEVFLLTKRIGKSYASTCY